MGWLAGMSDTKSGVGSKVPKLLKVVWGETSKLMTLAEFLYHVEHTCRTEVQGVSDCLEKPGDHPVYKELLHTTWCYPGPCSPSFKAHVALTQRSTQEEVLNRVIHTLMNSKGGRNNVLCYGHRQEMSSATKSSCGLSSGTAKLLLSPAWEMLLSRIGDTLMVYLLLNVSMFLKMKNQCYFQVTGNPMIDDARAVKKTSDAMWTKFDRRTKNTRGYMHMASQITQQISTSPGEMIQKNHNRSKKSRPSSWQRKKYRKALESKNTQSQQYPKGSGNKYVTQCLGSDLRSLSGIKARKNTASKAHYVYPKRFQCPSEMAFPREFIFYSSNYSRKCGLSSKHILMRLNPARNAGKVLYQFIFKSWLSPVGLKWNIKKPKHLSPLPNCSPVPKKHKYMIPWLTQMVKNAQKCQFGALLQAHCPLPLALVQSKRSEGKSQSSRPRKRPRDDAPSTLIYSGTCSDDKAHNGPPKRMTRLAKMLEEAKKHVSRSQKESAGNTRGGDDDGDDDIPDLHTSFVPCSNVAGFVWAAIRHIVPKKLLGGPRAQKRLRKAVQKFISLKRYENMTSHQALHKFPLSDLSWLDVHISGKHKKSRPPNAAGCKYRLASLWVGWLFSSLVIPILRNHFYCTENEAYRQQVFYYRKPVWTEMTNKAFNDTLHSTFLPIKQEAVKIALSSRKLGVSRLRFLPKRSGLRFLVNMSRPSIAKFPQKKKRNKASGITSVIPVLTKTFPAINRTLKYTLSVLQCEAHRQPEAFGSSTYGFDDIYCRYKPFAKEWKSDRMKEIAKNPEAVKDIMKEFGPHAVCVDVSRAFDNVDVRTLLNIISSLVTAEEYTILKFTEIVTVMGNIQVNYRNIAVRSQEVRENDIFHQASSLVNGPKHRVLLDCITTEKIKRHTVMKNLEDYLSLNLIKLKRKWRYQAKGIAQGGKPSTLLCSLYLGYVERVCFDPFIASCGIVSGSNGCSPHECGSNRSMKEDPTSLTAMGMLMKHSGGAGSLGTHEHGINNAKCPKKSHTVLIRLVDDWILISRHRIVAEQFAIRILQGIPGFNIKVNPSKTQTTFPLLHIPNVGIVKQNIYQEADGTCYIKWCGLLVNIQTLELRADYTRYCGEHVGISLNIPIHRNPGASLSSKLCHYIRPKILSVLMDQEINSPLTIRINVYQIFLLGAMKLHCFLCGLACPPKKGRSIKWILSAIETGIQYVRDSTKSKSISMSHGTQATSLQCNPGLPQCHVEYLGYHAFYTILKRKQSRYPELLQELAREMNEPTRKKCQPHLQEATHPLHSAIFDSIIF